MRFGRHDKKDEKPADVVTRVSELEQICEGDRETYEALLQTMFLDPRKIDAPIKEATDNAKKFEKEKHPTRARIWYDIAGGLAIYQGNTKKVAEYFGESQRISKTQYPILKNPEKAVTKAQEYYKKYLKD
jgi:hypothetical protein